MLLGDPLLTVCNVSLGSAQIIFQRRAFHPAA